MLYRFPASPSLSSGTYIDASGSAHFLDNSQFQVSPGQLWKSPHSGAEYPVAWEVVVPSLGLRLSEQPVLEDQELFTANSVSPIYWEGAVIYKGQMRERPMQGAGYLEMTGYARDARRILRAAPR